MNIYLINLDKDTEKLAFMTRQLDGYGLKYERVSAVYGKEIPPAKLKTKYSPFRWWCAIGRPIVPAEIGCAYSHYGIYEKMLPGEVVCILEDDVVLDSAFKERLSQVEEFVDTTKPQVIMLSSHEKKREGRGIVLSDSAMCTDAYVITYPAARAVLRLNKPMITPCDHWWRWSRKGYLELYHALPSVAKQDQVTFLGSTSEGRRTEQRLSLKFVFHKVKRLVGKPLDKILLKIIGR